MDRLINDRGFYGEFGGAWIPEMLHANIERLTRSYDSIIESDDFKKEFTALLKDYVGRPTPLYYAGRLSGHYGARIYLKREDLCHTGSHKLNNVAGQIILARRMNKKHIIAETGAGQHGVATATVCALMDLPCTIFMGEKDVARQQSNVMRMKMLGADVISVTSGTRTLKDATNEAIRYWINNPSGTHYLIGSTIGPHPYPDLVARLQAVISEEIKVQLRDKEGSGLPDYLVACVGGGSNAAGTFYNFIENGQVKLIGAEAAGEGTTTGKTAATIATGSPGIIHGCRTLLMQSGDGQITGAHSISAGLDYPGIGPLHAFLHKSGRAEYLAITDNEALVAARLLTRLEGIIPALESAHALAALQKLDLKNDDVVVVNLSGRGDKDMDTYAASMQDEIFTHESP
jgi:tryptophan synthase beta chain